MDDFGFTMAMFWKLQAIDPEDVDKLASESKHMIEKAKKHSFADEKSRAMLLASLARTSKDAEGIRAEFQSQPASLRRFNGAARQSNGYRWAIRPLLEESCAREQVGLVTCKTAAAAVGADSAAKCASPKRALNECLAKNQFDHFSDRTWKALDETALCYNGVVGTHAPGLPPTATTVAKILREGREASFHSAVESRCAVARFRFAESARNDARAFQLLAADEPSSAQQQKAI